MQFTLVSETDSIVLCGKGNPKLLVHVLSTLKTVLTDIFHPSKVVAKFLTLKKSSDHKFQTRKGFVPLRHHYS